MNLFLLRHGIAAESDPARYPDDSLRPLTAPGQQRLREIARALRLLDLGIDLIWCSPYLRTRQTADETSKILGLEDRLETQDQLAPDGDTSKLLIELAALKPDPDNVLLIGHEPYLSRLLSVVASGGSNFQADLKKGGLAKLETTGPLGLRQCAVLQWLLPPRLLVKIAR